MTVPGGATETITLAASKVGTSFGLYWGSVDAYNQIEFVLANGTTETFTGSSVIPLLQANGGTTSFSSNGYVEFTGFGTNGFTSVILDPNGNTQNAFEFDNVGMIEANRTSAVPETSTWAMIILGSSAVASCLSSSQPRTGAVRLV